MHKREIYNNVINNRSLTRLCVKYKCDNNRDDREDDERNND